MPARPILHFDIADRQMELREGVAPDDFVLLRRDTPHDDPGTALAYCADLQSERVLYTLHGDAAAAVFAAPFLYAAQLADARGALSVPFEALGTRPAVENMAPPTLIFSPGRTGSTLLARLLAGCGIACASEPDMLTQICRFTREDRLRIGFDMETMLLRACLASFGHALCAPHVQERVQERVQAGAPAPGRGPFIKLRSQCNARPLPLLQAAGSDNPGCEAVFMLRRMMPWALSRHRSFGEPPVSVAAILRQAIDALDKLLGADLRLHIFWFEDLCAAPVAELSRLLPRHHIDPECIAAIMAQDAQAGTAIAGTVLARAPTQEDFQSAFAAAWAEARAGAAWSRATLTHLAEMER